MHYKDTIYKQMSIIFQFCNYKLLASALVCHVTVPECRPSYWGYAKGLAYGYRNVYKQIVNNCWLTTIGEPSMHDAGHVLINAQLAMFANLSLNYKREERVTSCHKSR